MYTSGAVNFHLQYPNQKSTLWGRLVFEGPSPRIYTPYMTIPSAFKILSKYAPKCSLLGKELLEINNFMEKLIMFKKD